MSNLSNLLKSLIKKEGMSESLVFYLKKTYKKNTKKYHFSQKNLRESLVFGEPKREWATWANFSQLLICHERPELFAHSRSFVLSDLRKSLTVAHLVWAIWANEQMRGEQMSEFPTLEIFNHKVKKIRLRGVHDNAESKF